MVQDPTRYLNQCSPSSAAYFSFIPLAILRQCLCSLYTTIQTSSEDSASASSTLSSQLLHLGIIFVPIIALESQRQTRFRPRRGIDGFMLLATALSDAVGIPLYLAVTCHHIDSEDVPFLLAKTRPEHAWIALITTLVGYCLPLVYGVRTGWSNNAISVFLCSPLLFALLNQVLPPVVRGSALMSKTIRPSLPILIAATLAGILSAIAHVKLLISAILKHVFWPYTAAPNAARDLHVLLEHDYLFLTVALASYVLLRIPPKSPLARSRSAVIMLGQAAVLGPSAAIAWAWAKLELEQSTVQSRNPGRTALAVPLTRSAYVADPLRASLADTDTECDPEALQHKATI